MMMTLIHHCRKKSLSHAKLEMLSRNLRCYIIPCSNLEPPLALVGLLSIPFFKKSTLFITIFFTIFLHAQEIYLSDKDQLSNYRPTSDLSLMSTNRRTHR